MIVNRWSCEVPLIRDVDRLSLAVNLTSFFTDCGLKCFKQFAYTTTSTYARSDTLCSE